MPLLDRPDFQAWLKGFEARHEQLHAPRAEGLPGRCDGCGAPVTEQVSSTGLCLVCLAEAYGRDRARVASRVAGALRAALAREGDVPIEDVREAVEQALADHERELAERGGNV
jgi:hypothetical protein